MGAQFAAKPWERMGPFTPTARGATTRRAIRDKGGLRWRRVRLVEQEVSLKAARQMGPRERAPLTHCRGGGGGGGSALMGRPPRAPNDSTGAGASKSRMSTAGSTRAAVMVAHR